MIEENNFELTSCKSCANVSEGVWANGAMGLFSKL